MLTNFFKIGPQSKKNIFIVEDNDLYARLLRTFIQIRFQNIPEIKIFRIGEMCLMELHQNPSIVIMDYFLNSKYKNAQNGLEIIKRIKALQPEVHIIVLSAQENTDVILDAIKQFDCIYVQKNSEAFNKVVQSIKEIFNSDPLWLLNHGFR